MADAISIQELIDARTDAKTLEEAVNGDAVTTVLSRLGETYPTLSNALNQIDGQISDANDMLVESVTTLFENGGLPATPFATKALMTASALVDGDYAQVTDDTVNNGLYVKTAGAWVKSEYDPVAQAKIYTDSADIATLGSARSYTDDESLSINTKIDNLIINDGSNKGLFYVTKDGFPIIYVLNNGDLHVQGFEKPVQEYLVGEYEDTSGFIDLVDKNGDMVIRFESNSDIRLRGLDNTIKQELKELKAASTLALTSSRIDDVNARASMVDIALDVEHETAISKLHMIQSKLPVGTINGSARIPAIIGLANNKLLYLWGEGGDATSVTMYKRIITYADDGNIVDMGTKTIFRAPIDSNGISKHPMLCRNKEGHIVLVFDEKDIGRYDNVYYNKLVCISTDEGVTFSEPVHVPYPDWGEGTIVAVGSTGNMELLSTGRIVCPLYAMRNGAIATMYSDDDGETWTYSAPFETLYSTEGILLQEPATATLANGDILFSCRTPSKNSSGETYQRKYLCISKDGGETIQSIGFADDLKTPTCASSMIYDKERGLLIHSSPTGVDYGDLPEPDRTYQFQIHGRKRYRLQLSTNNGDDWKVASKPLDMPDTYMIAYSHIVKLKKDLYAVAVEGLSNVATTNSQESVGLLIINLKGVFANVVNS